MIIKEWAFTVFDNGVPEHIEQAAKSHKVCIAVYRYFLIQIAREQCQGRFCLSKTDIASGMLSDPKTVAKCLALAEDDAVKHIRRTGRLGGATSSIPEFEFLTGTDKPEQRALQLIHSRK